MLRRAHPFPLLALAYLLASTATVTAAPRRESEEITISSANYARSSRVEIQRAVNQRQDQEDPAPPAFPPPATPQRYLFTRGEIASTDVKFEDLCRRLEPVLAGKGLVSAINAQGRVPEPDKLSLILRVSYGPARWRDPVIRTTDLTWLHGLVPRAGTRSVGLTAVTQWEQRAGGDDFALGEAALAGEGGGTDAPADQLDSDDGERATGDYFLIVVDAFDYHDLLKNRHHSKRVWTTFISMSRRSGRKFSEIADAMLAKAAPYFGETTSGRVRFVNRRADVSIGELRVVEENVPRDTPPPAPEPKD